MAVDDPLSKYDEITSDDLFESFMDVAISIENEIEGNVITENHINGHINEDKNYEKYNQHSTNNGSINEAIYAKSSKQINDSLKSDFQVRSVTPNNGAQLSNGLNQRDYTPPPETHDKKNIEHSINNDDDSYCVPGSIITTSGATSRPDGYKPPSNGIEQDTIKDLYAVPKKDYPLIANAYKTIVETSDIHNKNISNEKIEPTQNSDNYSTVNKVQETSTSKPSFESQESLYSTPYALSSVPSTDINNSNNLKTLKVEDVAFSHRKKNNFLAVNKSSDSKRSPIPSSGQKKKFFGKSKSSENSKTRHKSWSGAKTDELMDDEKKSSTMPKPNNEDNPVVCSGFMFKQGGTGLALKNWKLRWFTLKEDHCLYYYKSEGETVPLGAVMLLNYDVVNALEVNKSFAFKLIKGGARTYYFAVNSEEERQKWKKHLHEASVLAKTNLGAIPECSLKNVSIPAMSITEPDCHGHIMKQGQSHKSWKRRYCVLKYGCLFYYENMSDTVAIGVFKLHNYTFFLSENIKNGIEAVPPGRKMRTYYFCMDNKTECKRWFESFKHSVASASK